MSSLPYSSPGGVGQKQLKEFHYSQLVRLPTGIVKLSGQGGWDFDTFALNPDDVDGQVDRAFANVDKVLKAGGMRGWEDVFLMRTYHVGIERSLGSVVEASKRWCPNHAPCWTAIGVEKLAEAAMLIEVEVEAFDASGK